MTSQPRNRASCGIYRQTTLFRQVQPNRKNFPSDAITSHPLRHIFHTELQGVKIAVLLGVARMNAAVIYDGRYDSTKEYAERIGIDTNLPVFHVRENTRYSLPCYDTIIIGSAVHAGKLLMGPWIKRNWNMIKDKKIILFSVAGTPNHNTGKLAKTLSASLSGEIIEKIHYHPLRGRMIFEELPLRVRFFMAVVSFFTKDKEHGKKMIQNHDLASVRNISAIVDEIKRGDGTATFQKKDYEQDTRLTMMN
jgi:menaquinone-dependent protoporphyrinogen IX oxidase